MRDSMRPSSGSLLKHDSHDAFVIDHSDPKRQAAGCTAEYQAAVSCEATLDPCETGCTAEVDALMRCIPP
jgi:hypothetical protein